MYFTAQVPWPNNNKYTRLPPPTALCSATHGNIVVFQNIGYIQFILSVEMPYHQQPDLQPSLPHVSAQLHKTQLVNHRRTLENLKWQFYPPELTTEILEGGKRKQH